MHPGVSARQPLDLKVARHSIFGFLGPNGGIATVVWIALLLAVALWRFGREEF